MEIAFHESQPVLPPVTLTMSSRQQRRTVKEGEVFMHTPRQAKECLSPISGFISP
jgi:hypothetical protein